MKYISPLVLLLFFSCSSLTKNEVKGNYEYRTEISKGNLVLSDNYFEYSYNAPMESYESKGNWIIDNKFLKLKSFENYKSNFVIVEEILDIDKSFIRLVLEDNTPLVGAIVIINSDSIFKTNEFGEIDLDIIKINVVKKIEIEVLDLPESERIYIPMDMSSKGFIIKIVPKDFNKFFFNDSFKIKKNKIKIYKQEYVK